MDCFASLAMTEAWLPHSSCHRPRRRTIQYSRAGVIDSRSRGVLDTPHARGMTTIVGAAEHVKPTLTRRPYSARLLLVRLLAADGLQLGEHGIDVEIVALFLARLEFRLLAGGLRGRQQVRAAVGGVGRLLLGRQLHLQVVLELPA